MTASPLEPYLEERARLAAEGWDAGAAARLPALVDDAVRELAAPIPPGVAVVAIGGYGREVMALHSDIDLFFLHPADPDADIEQRVLRPLWDAKLKVGHLSNTPSAARVFAGTRLDAISTFLTSRRLDGSEETFDEFWRLYVGLLEKEHLQIVTMLAAEERNRRAGAPYRLMASDLKTGRGGIRTIDLIDWRRRLFSLQHAPVTEPEQEAGLRLEMTALRSAIHASAGRLHDSYDFELREAAARYHRVTVGELGASIISLQRRAEQLVDADWPEVRAGRSTEPPVGGMSTPGLRDRSGLTQAAFDAAVTEIVPEWARLVDTPHIVPFHRYTVAAHSLACVDEIGSLLDPSDDPLVPEALEAASAPITLTWAALLHDIGKGLAGPHARAGARLVEHLPLPGDIEDRDLLHRLVEHHLLLADLATRHDLGDPAVLSWAADRITDGRTLAALYLLTRADSIATGTDTWNDWRSELVRRAYRAMERELRRHGMPEELQLEVLTDRVVAAADGTLSETQVRTHLRGFGRLYHRTHAPAEIAAHIAVAATRTHGSIVVRPRQGNPASLLIVTEDRPGLLLAVAGTLALERISITDARFATRSDDVVFDSFAVVSHDGHQMDERRLDDVAARIERAIRRAESLDAAVLDKQRTYRPDVTIGFEAVVNVEPVGTGSGRIDIEAADRIGLVYDIGRVFQAYGMPITRARVDTRGGIAYDSFWVDRLPVDRSDLVADLLGAVTPTGRAG